MKTRSSLVVRLLPFFDGVSAACIFALFLGQFTAGRLGTIVALLVVPFWVHLFRYFGLYGSHRVEHLVQVLRRIITANLIAWLVTELALYSAGYLAEAFAISKFALVLAVLMLLQRSAFYFGLRALRRGGFDLRNVCVLGDREAANRMANTFEGHPEWGLKVACIGSGSVDERHFTRFGTGEAMDYESLEDVLNQEVIDEVLIAVSPEDLPRESATMQLCERYGLLSRVLIQTDANRVQNTIVESFCGEVSIATSVNDWNEAALVMKRVLDVVLGVVGLVFAAPIMAVCALLVKISSPGPVFFRQTRVGLHGRRFTVLKFRTMFEGADRLIDSVAYRNSTKGPTFKDRQDIRVTEIGKILRRFSLDELPQLLMVVMGEMSLVGPRPLPVRESAGITGAQRRRFSVRPGLTCLWQVNGRSDVEFAEWMQYDLQYVDRWSLWLDAKLLVRTIPAVLSGRGAY